MPAPAAPQPAPPTFPLPPPSLAPLPRELTLRRCLLASTAAAPTGGAPRSYVAPADRHLAHFQSRLKNRDWCALASDLTPRDEGGGFSALHTSRGVSEGAVADREGKNADYTERTGKQASSNCAGAGVFKGAEARDLKRAAASLMVVTGAAAGSASSTIDLYRAIECER